MTNSADLRTQRMRRAANPAGHIAILAIDHVRSFAEVMRSDDPDAVTAAEIITAKTGIVERLAAHAGAVLIDPAFAGDATTVVSNLGSTGGVVLGIEDGDYADVHSTPRLLPGWDVEKAAALDVDAVKISVFFDAGKDNSLACRFVEGVGAQCALFDMPLFCEPLALMADDAPDRRRHVVEGVKLFGDLGVDVLKIQFPERRGPDVTPAAWAEACDEVDQLSPVPWTLLSEGRDFPLFLERLEIACRAGASGFLGGRAVWGDAVTGTGDLAASATRLDQLGAVVGQHGRPWDTRSGHSLGEVKP